MKKILVIDGHGGQLGKQIICSIKKNQLDAEITAVGTNSAATATMLKAGADLAATGENSIIVGARKSDIIVGPVGIAIADSLLGEITPAMAVAIGQSDAVKILLPVNKCNNIIVGIQCRTTSDILNEAINEIKKII